MTLGEFLGLSQINQKLDRIDNKLDKILLDQSRNVSADLERAIKAVSLMARNIDKKVPDKPSTPTKS